MKINFSNFNQTIQGKRLAKETQRVKFMNYISSTCAAEVQKAKASLALGSNIPETRQEKLLKGAILQKHIKDFICSNFDLADPEGENFLRLILPDGYEIRESLRLAWQDTIKFFRENPEDRMGWISQPTGSGKTGYFMALSAALPTSHNIIVVVPNKTLNDQTLKNLYKACPNRKITYLSSSNINLMENSPFHKEGAIDKNTGKVHRGNLVVIVDETFKNPQYLKQLLLIEPSLIIYDECHNYYVDRARQTRQAICNHSAPFELALSATPHYFTTVSNKKKGSRKVQVGPATLFVNDGRTANENFGKCIHQTHLIEAVKKGWIAPMAWFGLTLSDSTKKRLTEIEITENTDTGELDFNTDKLNDVLDEEFPEILKSCWELYENTPWLQNPELQHFAVCSNVTQAQKMAKFFTERGLLFKAVVGTTSEIERKNSFIEYDSGITRGLTSVDVLKEGWDAPIASVCWNLRPTSSYVLYMQVIGRVARLLNTNPDKIAAIVDLPLSCKGHSPINLARILGLESVSSGDLVLGREGHLVEKIKSNGIKLQLNPLVDYTQFFTTKDVYMQLVEDLEITETNKQIAQLLENKERAMSEQLSEVEKRETINSTNMYHYKVIQAVTEDLSRIYKDFASAIKIRKQLASEGIDVSENELNQLLDQVQLEHLKNSVITENEVNMVLNKKRKGYHYTVVNDVKAKLNQTKNISQPNLVRKKAVAINNKSTKKKRASI